MCTCVLAVCQAGEMRVKRRPMASVNEGVGKMTPIPEAGGRGRWGYTPNHTLITVLFQNNYGNFFLHFFGRVFTPRWLLGFSPRARAAPENTAVFPF